MSSDTWMAVKLYVPAALTMVAALLLLELSATLSQSAVFSQIANALRWGSLGAAAATIGFITHATVRLVRAEMGKGLLCGCGGLLGSEIDGQYGPYRRCLRCSRNVAQRHYE